MTILEDGTGTGKKQKVDGNNRSWTKTVSVKENHNANEDERAFNINTGDVTLTTANESAVAYVLNNEKANLHIFAIAIGLGPSTGGSVGVPNITVVRNPTGGTIVDGATAVSINSNRNFGSAETLDITAYKGDGTALTLTGGADHLYFYQTANGRLYAEIDEILPKGSSLGVKITPQGSNTSMACYVAFISHLEDLNE